MGSCAERSERCMERANKLPMEVQKKSIEGYEVAKLKAEKFRKDYAEMR